MITVDKIRVSLENAASELNPENRWPVDIIALLDRLGIALEFDKVQSFAGKAYLVLSENPRVRVPWKGREAQLARNQRFSVAHELGHWVVWRKFGVVPSSKRDYWKHEMLCNKFASDLLVPPKFLGAFLSNLATKQCVNSIFFPSVVAASAMVSWDVSARAISALPASNLAYLKISIIALDPSISQRQPQAEELEVACSSVADKTGHFLGDRARIKSEMLVTWLRSLPNHKITERALTATLGRMCLTGVDSNFVRQSENSWIAQFRKDDKGLSFRS